MNPPAPAGIALVVLAATFAQVFASMGSSTMPVIAPKLAETFGVDASLIGLQVSLLYGCATLGALFAAGLVRRLGATRTSQVALAFTTLGMLCAATPSLAVVAIAAVPIGIGIGILSPAAAHLMIRYAPARSLNLVFSLKQTGVPGGHMLSALSAPMIAVTLGWRWSLALVALLSTVMIALLQRGRARWDDDRDPSAPLVNAPLAGVAAVWSHPPLRRMVVAAALFSAVQVTLATFTVNMLVQDVGYGLVQAGAALSIVNLAGVLGRVAWGWIADRVRSGTAVLAGIGLLMTASCGVLVFLSAAWPVFLVNLLFAVIGTSVVGWNGVMNAEVTRMSVPGTVHVTTSGLGFFVFGSIFVMPSLFTALYGVIGRYTHTFGAALVLSVTGTCLILSARRIAGLGRRAGADR